MNKEELKEVLKSTRNRCEVCIILLQMQSAESLLHTILEDMCEGSQKIAEEYCANGTRQSEK